MAKIFLFQTQLDILVRRSHYGSFRFIDHEAFLDNSNAPRNFCNCKKKFFVFFFRFLKARKCFRYAWLMSEEVLVRENLEVNRLRSCVVGNEAPAYARSNYCRYSSTWKPEAAIIWVNKHLQPRFYSSTNSSPSRTQSNCSELIKSKCEDGKIISCAWTWRYWASLE